MSEVVRTVGRYEILRELGRGGMAVVYVARQTELHREVALKELGAFHAADPEFAQRFERESRLAGSLNHPNIVTVHDYFVHDGVPYIAMEYVRRGSLRAQVGRLTLAQILGVLEGLLAGLAHAHESGVIHRDLKPENLMVTTEGRIKIADFGIAKALDPIASRFVTATGLAVGTPAYMAPEQAMAQEVGPWTDLYATGVVAYELLSGRVPFNDSDTPVAVLMRHVNEPVPPLVTLAPDLDPRLVAWVERLLAKPPSDRPRHATEAWEALEETAIDLLGPRWTREARLVDGDGTPTPPAPPTRAVGATVPAAPRGAEVGTTRAGDGGRRRWLWVGAALLVLGLAAGAVAAIVAGNGGSGGNNGRAATVSTGPTTLTQVAFSEDERSLTTKLEFGGSPLKGDSVHTLDAAIGDGAAAVGVAGRRIRTRVARESHDGLTVRVLRQPGRLRVALSGRSGAFVALAARLEPPSTVVITLTKIARPKTGRAAADALVQAWKAGDRDAALAVADKAVVAKLFRLAFPEPAPRLQDCGSVGTGQIECAYEYDFGQRTVGFKAYESGGIFHVLEISFT